jgi:hypothetical protein
MDEKTLFEAVEELRNARQVESDCAMVLADAEASLGRIRAIFLAGCYESGKVDGKNEAQRKLQEVDLLAQSEVVKNSEGDLRLATSKHAVAKIERQYRENRFQALLALLNAVGHGDVGSG